MSYSSTHNHTMYSLLDGFSTPKEYLDRARELGLRAFAVTEHGSQYSWVYFHKLKKEYPEIKILYGVELYECFNMKIKDKDSKYFHLIALAKNEKGRIALNEIVTKSNFEGFYFKPRVDLELLKPYGEDLVISSACLGSKLAKEKDYITCLNYVKEYKEIFPHFYLEMQSHTSEDQIEYNKKILQLSKDTSTPYIITTDSHSATKEDLYYQQRHVQIAQDRETMNECYEGCYMLNEDEIIEAMSPYMSLEQIKVGLENTNKIADLIEEVNMPFQEPQLPSYPLPKEFQNDTEYLRYLAEQGWKQRRIDNMTKEEQKIRRDRIDYELDVIARMGFDGYFIIVWDFINWARENNIRVGDGRGSGAGSLVCYILGITNLDPIKYGLIFERFLNEERISMPDLDVDLSDRGKVIEYLTEKYGEENVCQIINFSYITPVVAIKDVGKVLKIPYKITDKISKRFSYDTFEECMKNNPNIIEECKKEYDEDMFEKIQEMFKIASKISGKVRQVSCHAGGVGITDNKITDYMAMKLGSKGEHVIQVDKKIIEEIGIIKFDLLGVQTLSLVQEVVDEVGINNFDIDINNPKFETDELAYSLLSMANTMSVFQVESQGMRDLLLRLKPQNMEELSAVIALYRPDSMSALEDFIKYKSNPKEIKYIHEDMKPILEMTYGNMIYQEQLLDIVRKFGGRTYGGADRFRKGIGKKCVELVRAEAEMLYKEILTQNYGEYVAKTISDDMKAKGNYLFNKSHSFAYAVLCLQTAYLKKHYPVAFFKAVLNRNKDDYGKLNKYIIDAQENGVVVAPPNINKSDMGFKIHNNKILFGLGAIKGLGEQVVGKIIEERNTNGDFKGLEDFKDRVSLSDSQIVALVKSGAIPTKDKEEFLLRFADLTFNKSAYKDVVSLPTLKKLKEIGIDTDRIKNKDERLELYNNYRRINNNKLQTEKYKKHINEFEEKYMQDKEMWEFETLSIFLGENPFKDIYDYITPFEDVEDGGQGVVVGVVSNIIKKKDRHKNQFAYVTIYSAFGIIEATCWASNYKKYQDIIKKGEKLAILCEKKEDKAYVVKIKDYDNWYTYAKKKLM